MWETILQYWWVALILLIAPPIIRSINAPRMPRPPQTPAPNRIEKAAASYSNEEILTLAKVNKIEAIKMYRQKTGLGLKEAMDAVDLMLLDDLDKNG